MPANQGRGRTRGEPQLEPAIAARLDERDLPRRDARLSGW